jgi:hypothetical protein
MLDTSLLFNRYSTFKEPSRWPTIPRLASFDTAARDALTVEIVPAVGPYVKGPTRFLGLTPIFDKNRLEIAGSCVTLLDPARNRSAICVRLPLIPRTVWGRSQATLPLASPGLVSRRIYVCFCGPLALPLRFVDQSGLIDWLRFGVRIICGFGALPAGGFLFRSVFTAHARLIAQRPAPSHKSSAPRVGQCETESAGQTERARYAVPPELSGLADRKRPGQLSIHDFDGDSRVGHSSPTTPPASVCRRIRPARPIPALVFSHCSTPGGLGLRKGAGMSGDQA